MAGPAPFLRVAWSFRREGVFFITSERETLPWVFLGYHRKYGTTSERFEQIKKKLPAMS